MQNCSGNKIYTTDSNVLLMVSVGVNMFLLICNMALLYNKFFDKTMPPPPPPAYVEV
jgi:hypothetical protein